MTNYLANVDRASEIARDMDERREESKVRNWMSVTREFEDALCALNELYYEAHRRDRDGYHEFGRLCRDFNWHFEAIETMQKEWQDAEACYEGEL